jgi:hypothetical protein
MTAKRTLYALSAILILLFLLSVILHKSTVAAARFNFENTPKAIFTDVQVAASQKPQLARSPSGVLSVLAVADTKGLRRLIYTRSQDDGDHFSPSLHVSADGSNVIASGENIPSLIQVPTGLYATWQERTPEERHRIMFSRSADMGLSFEKPVEVTDSRGTAFNGFSSMNVAPNGDIYVVWLDGRDQPEPEGTLGLYLAKSSDGGRSFETNSRIVLGACPCCRPAIAFGETGQIYVSWRKVFAGDVRDVVLATSNDGGLTFSVAKKVGEDQWVVHGCPDSGPSMANIGRRLYIAWYSEGNRTAGIRIAVSDDGGKTFSLPDLASRGVFSANHPQLSIFNNDHILLTFQGRQEEKPEGRWTPLQIFVATLDPLGQGASPEALPAVDSSAFYPSTLPAGPDRIFIAWTGLKDNAPTIELSRGIVR